MGDAREVRILGLDPGSTRFGYAVIVAAGTALRYIEAGVIEAPARAGKYERLGEIGRELEEVIDEFKPDEAALEAGFVNGQQGALTSGAARGVAAYVCVRRGLSVVEYSPATVKKSVTGNGASDKDAVARMVQLHLKLRVPPAHDAADALAVAIAHVRRPTVLLRR